MGLFDRKNNIPDAWIKLDSEKQLDKIIEQSHTKPQVIFKDSTSCGISSGVKHELTGGWDSIADKADLHYLDLLSFRSVSNKVAEVSGVTHQSPQVIVYYQGEVVADTSHFAIKIQYLEEVLTGLS